MIAFYLFLYFSSSIRIIVDKTNFQSLIDISFRLPVFIVFYSPYCPHCTRMHPDWLQFMEKYKDDPFIVAAEINCMEFRKEASKIMSITGYPTYAVVIDGHGKAVSVERTTAKFCAKAEEIKKKYPSKSHSNIKCHFFMPENEDNRYPFMTLLASYYTDKSGQITNFLKGNDEACDLIQQISEETELNLENFFIHQIRSNISSSVVISKVFLNPKKTIEYKFVNYSNNESIYNFDSLSLFAKEYLVYKQFGDWDIVNDTKSQEFAFIKSNRRLVLFVFESNDLNDDQSISNRIIMKYKATVTNNVEFFLANRVSSNQLKNNWNINIFSDSNPSNNTRINLIVSNRNKSNFTLIKNIQSENFNEIAQSISSGFYDDKNDEELEPIKKMIKKISSINKRNLLNQHKRRKSPLTYFAIAYFVCALIITVVIVVYLLVDKIDNSIDARKLIEHSDDDSDNENSNDNTNILTVEDDDDVQDSNI